MSTRLAAYLAIEAEMIRLDDAGDALADDVRDLLDKIWYGLSDAEHEALSGRQIVEGKTFVNEGLRLKL